VLLKVRIFGHNPEDIAEEQDLRALFDAIDKGEGGVLEKDEMKDLFKEMNLVLKPTVFEVGDLGTE